MTIRNICANCDNARLPVQQIDPRQKQFTELVWCTVTEDFIPADKFCSDCPYFHMQFPLTSYEGIHGK